MSDLTERLFKVLKRHPTLKRKDDLASFLGCSRSMLYHYEKGEPAPPAEVLRKLTELEVFLSIGNSTDDDRDERDTPPKGQQSFSRKIPVLGWAHAGQAASYEQLPHDWCEFIPSSCRDPKSFAVVLEGDSMEPRFSEGDILELMPSSEVYNGCLAVIRLASDGVIFRRVELRRGVFRLVPLNPRYEIEEFPAEEISWAYPVWSRSTQLWKR